MIKAKLFLKYKFLNHSFFNKKGGVSKGIYKSLNCGLGSNDKKHHIKKNIMIVSRKLGLKRKNLIIINQIHSNKFYIINKVPNKKLTADGLITNKRKIGLGILTADCAPVFILDYKKKIIAAAHVGWKGAYKKILIKILDNLINQGCQLNNLISVVGPCISQNNYEVKKDFRKRFLNQDKKKIKYFKNINNKIYFSLGDYIRGQMVDYGLKNVEIIKKDTFYKKNNFFSARNSSKNHENDYGRNIPVIMIK